ncbi:hypothetical protein ACLOJK_006011 [Asimina triloba]
MASCGKHGHKRKKIYRFILYGLLAFLLAVLLTILIIYLVLRPAKPSFTLQDATLYQFNLTSPNALTTILQITLYSTNSNDRIGIYYDSLSAYASYAYQQITLRTTLPALYLDCNTATSWSPFLYGPSVPVAPYVAVQLGQDQTAGASVITVQVDGSVRWRVGSWVSGHYRLDVTCQAYVSSVGAWGNAGPNMRLHQPVSCSTNV